MSYALSAGLQKTVYQILIDDDALRGYVGDAIYDVVPAGQQAATYVSLGPEDVHDWSDKTGSGARYDFSVSVLTERSGFHKAKVIAGAVADALVDADRELDRGKLVAVMFRRARAVRVEDGQMHRIDLSFRALVAND